MAISSLGIGSGLDLSGLVTNLLAAERAPTENSLIRQESNLSAELSGVGLMRSALSGFQSTLAGLANSDTYRSRNVTNSDSSAVSVSADNDAALGQYSISVTDLAQAHSLASGSFGDINEEIGTGALEVTFGTITGPGFTSFSANADKTIQTIAVDSSNNTLSTLRDHINEGDFGFSASIVNDGSGYRLVLQSDSTGIDSALQINVTDTGDGDNFNAEGLSLLANNATATNMTETVVAQDASLSINGLPITSNSNTLSSTIEGLSISLNAETTSAVQIGISEDSSKIRNALEDLVEGYNGMISSLNDLSLSNPESGSGLLAGDASLRNFLSNLRNQLTSPVEGLSGDVRALVDVGIKTQADGTLSIDESDLSDALSNNPDDVIALLAPLGQTTDNQISFNAFGDDSQAGLYAVNITTAATQGSFDGAAVLNAIGNFPFTVDADNDSFSLSVDGFSSGTVTLTQGSYASGEALAAEIQLQINSAQNLQDNSARVSVSYDSDNSRLQVASERYGSESSVEFTVVETQTAAELGFSVAAGTAGTDVAGTIGGLAASGDGQVLSGSSGAVKGIELTVEGSSTGDRGSLRFTRGFAEELSSLLGSYLDADGILAAREDGLNESLEGLDDQRDALDLRLEALEAQLVSQFSALDALVAQFQSTSNFLTTQLANLPKPGQLNND